MIPQKVLEFAVEKYGFNPDTLEYIPRISGKIANQVYSFYKDDKKFIIKFEPPHNIYNNQLLETRALMDLNYYLAKNYANVPTPLKTRDGELVVPLQDENNNYIITAFEWLNGKTWAYEGSNNNASFNWGKAMGNIHCAVKEYIPSNEFDVQKDIFDSQHWVKLFDSLKPYPTVHKIAQELISEISSLPRDRDSFGIIHGDMHQGNIFINEDEVSVFDFGDSMYGWFTLDIAITLCHALWWSRQDKIGNDYTISIIENFMKGYLSVNPLSDFWISKIPTFMKYRHLCMNPEKNGLGCTRDEWVHNIENDVLFDGFILKSVVEIIEHVKTQKK